MDADEFAVQIKEWPAGISAREGAVADDETVDIFFQDAAESQRSGAIDLISTGVTEGERPVAFIDGAWFGAGDVRVSAGIRNLTEGGVPAVSFAQGLGFDLVAI